MSVNNPAFDVPRQSVVGMEGMWCKMWDPPTESPVTPDELAPTNPVPEVMAAAGFQSTPSTPHVVERDLLHGDQIPTWDGAKKIMFYLIRDANNPTAVGTYPGPIVRVPRGVVYHAHTSGHGPPPHTIHWHGIEPTPINDGVGHCSMEIGDYTYQWQPNFIGFYFYHCHRNTVQHFEYGLYSLLMVEPPDAYFATQVLGVPIGHCRDGKRRIAAGLDTIKDAAGNPVANPFPGFNNNPIDAPDPWTGDPALKFPVDPHAMTVPYDVEVIWGVDDRDSRWSDLAPGAFATYPRHGDIPGVNDDFQRNYGKDDFFAFNEFRPDYFYVTGVPVPAHTVGNGGTGVGTIPTGSAIPGGLNSGVVGTQVAVSAEIGKTILLRCIDGAYVNVTYRLPVDAVVIAWDGRSLGIPPYTQYNHPYLVKAGEPIHASVARRFDALIKVDSEFHGFAEVDFVDTRGMVAGTPGYDNVVLLTARIPFDIGTAPVVDTFTVSGKIADGAGNPMAGASVNIFPHSLGGSTEQIVATDAGGNYTATVRNGMYQITPFLPGFDITPESIDVNVNGADIPGNDFVAAVAIAAFDVMGVVTDDTGTPMAGVAIAITGTAAADAVTDAAGEFTAAGLVNGNYVVTPSLAGKTFAPPSRAVAINGADSIGQNFVGTAATTFAVSGNVADTAGAPIAGVTISVSGAATASATTDAAGNYSAAGLINGGYIITPVKAGFTFAPPSRNVIVNGADVTAQNFAATAPKFAVSGKVVDAVGDPMAGVSIAVSGAATASATTDAAGNYNLALADGSYVITPSRAGFAFNPPSSNVVVAGADISIAQSFAAVQTAAGNVTVTKVTVSTPNSRRGPLWTVTGTGTPGATITIILGPDLVGEQLGTTIVSRRGKWTFRKRVIVQTLVDDWTSVSVSSSDGSVTPNISLITVRTARVNTRGAAAITKGPSWSLLGKGAPGSTLTIFLGPDLTGQVIGTTTVNPAGNWKLTGRIQVTQPITATSISISSSAGGSVLDEPLTVRN